MQKQLPKQARVVIIGGGSHGCSVAYHLAKEGWKDVVLLERKQLTCGTTWHAAGLVGRLQGGHATTAFAQYGSDLFQQLEKETGQATGYRKPGSISVASNPERWAELLRQADFARIHNEHAQVLSVDEVMERWPMMNPDGIVGGVWIPGNGYINPIDLTMALAKGARQHGAQIFEQTKVLEVTQDHGRASGVVTDQGEIKAEYVVNCAGMWARELGRQNGVGIALHACEHYYLVTDKIEGLPQDLPVLRAYDDCTSFKEDAGKLLFGFAHNKVKPWGMKGIPEDFCFDSLPFVDEDVMDVLEMALNRVPLLQETGIRTFFNGPESYSFDGRFTLGEAPEVQNYFILAGVNSTGIQSGAGAGRALAQWIMQGYPPMDLNDMDPARIEAYQARDLYLQQRAPETETKTYAMHWPNDQRATVRPLRKTPFYHPLKARGACFAEAQGWERPAWFAPEGIEPTIEYSFGRQNWFNYAQQEQQAVREGVGMIDYSMLGKLLVEGPDAEAFMQRVCSQDMAMACDRVAYTLLLNGRGGIESDITVARFAPQQYMVMSSIARRRRDQVYLQQQILPEEQVTLRDVTTAYGVLSIAGPLSRELLQKVSDHNFANEDFPFQSWQEFYVGHAPVWAQRLSFTGELGWEIFVTPDFAEHVLEQLLSAGKDLGLRLVGGEALNALRIEKGFLHWGHDLAYTEAPHQLGLGFLCRKEIDFIGKQAAKQRAEESRVSHLCQIAVSDPEPLLYHNEPILRDGEVIGFVTSGAWAYHTGSAVGLAFVNQARGSELNDGKVEVLVEGKAYEATLSWQAVYDPTQQRCRS